MLVIPLISLLFFAHFLSVGLPNNLPIAVVDGDNTYYTRLLVTNLNDMSQVEVAAVTPTFDDARVRMQKGEVYGIFVIPKGFTSEVIGGRQPLISYYHNAAYMMSGSLVFKEMKMISELANGKVRLTFEEAHGIPTESSMGRLQPIPVTSHLIGNDPLNYSVYLTTILIPGILELMVFFVTVFSIGFEIKYRRSRQLLAFAGGRMTTVAFGKLSLHFVIYALYGLLMMSVFHWVLDFPLANGFWPLYIGLLLMILASQAMGLFFVSVLPTLRLGLSFSALVGMLALSLSGFTFPVSAMPPPVQAIAALIPLRHYFLIYVEQALDGAPLLYSIPHYIALIAMLLLPVVLSKRLKRAFHDISYIP